MLKALGLTGIDKSEVSRINKELSQHVAKLILSGELKPGQTLHIGHADNQLQFNALDTPESETKAVGA